MADGDCRMADGRWAMATPQQTLWHLAFCVCNLLNYFNSLAQRLSCFHRAGKMGWTGRDWRAKSSKQPLTLLAHFVQIPQKTKYEVKKKFNELPSYSSATEKIKIVALLLLVHL